MSDPHDPRRALPSVDRLLALPDLAPLLAAEPRAVVVAAVRAELARARLAGGTPPADWAGAVAARVRRHTAPSLHPVLNATGIVLHTNLGRAPLAEMAIEAITLVARDYSTLEFTLETGTRGHRADHCGPLLAEISGAEAGLAVNNAAGALVLALNAMAAGREVILSRGEMIEIGGSFRIPEILEKSGAALREVGTTNRTHLADYQGALSDRTGAILIVHRSNFAQTGYVASPEPVALARLAAEHGVPCLYDLGSGLVADLTPWGLTGEPRVADGVASGAALVVFSGDKLLGGPQAGCLVGTADVIARCRANPFARAMRADKLTLAALEATLALYRDPERALREIPVLRALTLSADELQRRAEAIRDALPGWCGAVTAPGVSGVGGGSFPSAELPTTLVLVDPAGADIGADDLAHRLRLGTPALITRIIDGKLALDPRTLPEESAPTIAAALTAAREDPA